MGVRTSELVDSAGVNHVSGLDIFSRVTQSQDINGNPDISYDGAGEVTSRNFSYGMTQSLTWDSFGRLVKLDQRNSNNQGYNWVTLYDGLGRRIQTSCNGNTINYYYDPQLEFMEIGHSLNGSRTWNLFGPDRSGIYGGAQGIGGLEIEGTEGSSSGSVVVNNYFGDVLALINSGVVSTYDSTFISYGLAPGSSVNEVTQSLEPQWRGHYLDWTGFYYMGARYYDPVEGRFISADPLGHGASMSLYDYCNGDPVNGLDPDGRCVEGGAKGYTMGAFASYDNIPQALGGFAGTIGSYLTSGVGEAALLRDIAGSAWHAGKALGDMWDNGANWKNSTELGLSAVGVFGGSYAAANLERASQIAVSESATTLSELPDSYMGIQEASQYLQDMGVSRAERVRYLQSFEPQNMVVKQASGSEFGLRYFSDPNRAGGQYLFETFPALRSTLAIKPEWNSMIGFRQFQIRPGATVLEGEAASQGPYLPGKQIQKFILDWRSDLIDL